MFGNVKKTKMLWFNRYAKNYLGLSLNLRGLSFTVSPNADTTASTPPTPPKFITKLDKLN